MSTRVLLATRNEGKLRELLPLLSAAGLTGETLTDAGLEAHPDEDGLEVFERFEENALAKARWFASRGGGGVVLAEDSGLAVDALGGRPGVRSKRWSARAELSGSALDVENNAMLQVELSRASIDGAVSRRARYVCAAACVWRGGELVVLGETHGALLRSARGSGGFGYDPYFLSDDLGCTFAEASPAAKAAVSHRGRAFRALLERVHGEGVC